MAVLNFLNTETDPPPEYLRYQIQKMYGCTPLEAMRQPWHLVRQDIESANATAQMAAVQRKLQAPTK